MTAAATKAGNAKGAAASANKKRRGRNARPAKKTAEERFDKYFAKAQASSPVKLDDGKYKEITLAPRDYTAVVLLTAMDARFGCQLCREFQPEWDVLAKSWTEGDKKGESRLIFGTLDFADGRETFMSVSLVLAPNSEFNRSSNNPNS